MFTRALLALYFFTAALSGQVPVVNTEILAVALDQPVDGLFIDTGKGIQPFTANLTGLGLPVLYQGPRRLVLHKTIEAFHPPEGQPTPQPAGIVELPASGNRMILVCLLSPEGTLKMVAYDISSGRMKSGDYRFFNYSKLPVSFIVGEKKFGLTPGTDTVVTGSNWSEEVLDLEVQFGISPAPGQAVKRCYASVWGHRPGRRNYVFVFDGSHPSKPITARRFNDIPPAITAAR
jgi:hypothetical protein